MDSQQLDSQMLGQSNALDAANAANLAMAAQHLNVPIGPVVRVSDLALALRSGSLKEVVSSDAAAAMAYLFVEVSPSLIASCVREAGGSFTSANRLYLETVKDGMPRVPAWEQSVEHLV
jgi:hypothetical protein